LEIAKNDKSDPLKLEAIRALGQSKDPEALKYLEEILK
jgi:HEAT repeat protein